MLGLGAMRGVDLVSSVLVGASLLAIFENKRVTGAFDCLVAAEYANV